MFKRLIAIFLLPFALITTLAYGQVFLGNVFRLGTSTDAAKPAAANVNRGGLLFITDGDAGTGVAGAVAYSNGTSWLPLSGSSGGSGSTNFWYDAGNGLIFAQEAIYNPDAGTDLRFPGAPFGSAAPATSAVLSEAAYPTKGIGFGNLGSMSTMQGIPYAFTPDDGQWGFAIVNSDTTYGAGGLLMWNQSNGGGFGQAPVGISFLTGTVSPTYYGKITAGGASFGYASGITVSVQPARNFGFRNDSSGTLWWTTEANNGEFNFVGVSSTNDAIQLNNGARLHLGSGTNDYIVSDGTGLETPGYWESTLAFASGAGVIAQRVQAYGGTNDSLTTAAANAAFPGTMQLDTTFDEMTFQQSGSKFSPFGMPHITYGSQTFTTRVVQNGGLPELAERVASNTSGGLFQMYHSPTGCTYTTGVSSNRQMYGATTAVELNRQCSSTTASSAAPTVLAGIVNSDTLPMMCIRIRTGATITNSRWWAGLSSAATASATSTMAGNGAMFRYDTSVDGLLRLCTRDGTTQSCASTGITVASTTMYHLCVRLDSARAAWGWVNGVYVAKVSGNVPAANTMLAPWNSFETLTASANGVLWGPTLTQGQ